MPEVIESEWEVRQREIEAFKMPDVRAGRIVRWFKEGDRNCQGYIGHVLSVGQKAVKLRILNPDTPWETNCHHIDDPELKYRKALAKNSGAWDFTPEDKERDEAFLALEKLVEQKERMNSERVAALNKRLESLEKELGVKKG